MPRKARVVLPNTPHHVVQRGHNRNAVFVEDRDYRYYLDNLLEWKETLECRVYAYCLMTNHVHIVIDPGETPEHLSLLMKRLAGRQTRWVNAQERRSGSLWEGRFKSSPIQTLEYLLACTRYVELNPVRAKMVTLPEDYPWSSYQRKVGMQNDSLIDADDCYLALGADESTRQAEYATYVNTHVSQEELTLLRQAVRREQLTGNSLFIDEVERRIGIRIEQRGPGRPLKRGDEG